jgi:Do/DeqQ family serine protease
MNWFGGLVRGCGALVVTACLAGVGVAAAQAPAGVATLAPMLARVTPGVVGISIGQSASRANPLLADPFFKRFFEENAPPRGAPSGEVEVRPAGSGVIIDAREGLVITNNHVVQEATRIVVVLKDRRELEARLIGRDPATDVALLKIPAGGLTEVPIGDSDQLQVGDFVVAIGNPFGIGQTVTSGIVSALGRGISPEGYEDYIQTDAAINPGNSGGALVDLNGRLVGINTAILSGGGGQGRAAGNIGIGFAVPTSMSREVVAQLLRHGEMRRGRIGVQTADVTPRLAAERKLPLTEGAIVALIEPGSPAEGAGLKIGDIVVRINGRAVRGTADLRNRVALMAVDSTADLLVHRGAAQVRVPIKVAAVTAASARGGAAAPGGPTAAAGADLGGLELAGDPRGVVVVKADPAGRGHAVGLRAGDLILGVNREPVTSPAEFARAMGRAGEKVISILRGESKLRFVVS